MGGRLGRGRGNGDQEADGLGEEQLQSSSRVGDAAIRGESGKQVSEKICLPIFSIHTKHQKMGKMFSRKGFNNKTITALN